MFADPVNPDLDEIRAWAYTPGALEPMQDWDLILEGGRHDRLYLELASDPHCPMASYFLHVLYLVVGDAIRTGYESRARDVIEDLLECGERAGPLALRRWAERARRLMAHPAEFSYAAWCGGDLAYERPT